MNDSQKTPMKIDVRINTIRLHGKVRAFASITLADCFVIRGVRIIEASAGLFAAMPNNRMVNGGYRDICFPVMKELREQINEAVLEAYRQALIQVGEQPPQAEESAFDEGGYYHE